MIVAYIFSRNGTAEHSYRQTEFSVICINLVSKYDCGHESKSNIPCKDGRCKEITQYNRTKQCSCIECIRTLVDRVRRERNDEKQKARDAESVSAKVLQQQKAERQTNSKILAEIQVRIETSFACEHRVRKLFVCDQAKHIAVAKAAHQKNLLFDIHPISDKNCEECRIQEEVHRDEAYARLIRAHAAETQTVLELREQIEEMGNVGFELEALRQERDELAARLDMLEGEIVENLRDRLQDDQHQGQDIDAQLNLLIVEHAEFMRQTDDHNAAMEIAILALEEELRTAFSQNDEHDAQRAIEQQEDNTKQALSEVPLSYDEQQMVSSISMSAPTQPSSFQDRRFIILCADGANDSEQLLEVAGANIDDAQVYRNDVQRRSRDQVAAAEDDHRNNSALEVTAVINQLPKVKPGKPPKPPKPTELSSASKVDLGDAAVTPDGFRDVMKELVETRARRQR